MRSSRYIGCGCAPFRRCLFQATNAPVNWFDAAAYCHWLSAVWEFAVGHFALAADTYTHFTSPIRRYPDLIVHRLLRGVLTGTLTGRDVGLAGELPRMADECSQSERRAADAERELVEWKKVKFMAERVGEDFDALIISTAKYGLFVELAEMFIEGLVPIDTLPGDQYFYQENVRKIVGKRTRREFSIGDAVRVVLDRVDGNDRKLQFSLLEEAPRQRRRKK